MTPPVLLIAERELRAYVATASFWVALGIGPLALALALGLAALASHPAAVVVGVTAPSAAAERSAAAALTDAARLEGRAIRAVRGDTSAPTRLVVSESSEGTQIYYTGAAPPLSPVGQALVARTIERDGLAARLGVVMASSDRVEPAAPPDGRVAARFALMMMLWLTLTGSLGMLLQAVVRERANRALEGLLAAASPADVVFGKLVGVGAVSLLVLGAWLGSAAALAPLAPKDAGLAAAVLGDLGDPLTLARAGLIYILAFAFYGLLTIAVGAAARDTAQAQNLSRPMFAVLLAAFFAAMASAGGGPVTSWLAIAPPFSPFVLLALPPGALSPAAQISALASMGLGAALCAVWAMRGLELGARSGQTEWLRKLLPARPAAAAR
jgi:ABC-2 type transport system permease protein